MNQIPSAQMWEGIMRVKTFHHLVFADPPPPPRQGEQAQPGECCQQPQEHLQRHP